MISKRFGQSVAILVLMLFAASVALIPQANAADAASSLSAEIDAANRSSDRHTVALSADITLDTSLPALTGSLKIEGNGYTISGDDEFRIFDVNGGTLHIENLTMTEGRAAVNGGAIRLSNDSQVTIVDSIFANNTAKHGGAIATPITTERERNFLDQFDILVGFGEAADTTETNEVAVEGNRGRLVVTNSRFVGNIAEASAGAIYAAGGSVDITNSHFEKNCAVRARFEVAEGISEARRTVDADGCVRIHYIRPQPDPEAGTNDNGGAIRLLDDAQASIESSTFVENKATFGGAISTSGHGVGLTIDNSSFVSNLASANGGGIGSDWRGGGAISIRASSFVANTAERGGGGAISATRQRIDIANSTFSENNAERSGGALLVDESAEVTITHATFVENRSAEQGDALSNIGGRLLVRNSIIASPGRDRDCAGRIEQSSGNLNPDRTCGGTSRDEPLLGALTGDPAHFPLQDRSPAVDAADAEFCLAVDQIGISRPQGGACDIGAIESLSARPAEPTQPASICNLPDLIIAANTGRTVGACRAGSGNLSISLAGDYTLSEALPAITGHITIDGNGHTISGDRKYRIFDVSRGSLTIKNLTLKDGRGAGGDGGAIRLQHGGRAIVSNSRFVGNSAGYGGAVFIGWVDTQYSLLTVDQSSFVGNGGNGTIYAGGGTVLISNSSFVKNTSAIRLVNPVRLDVVNSSFIDSGIALSAENGVNASLTNITFRAKASPMLELPNSSYTSPSSVSLYNSIVVSFFNRSLCDQLTRNIGNLIENGDCPPALDVDPLFEDATEDSDYLALKAGSPAIGAANANYCPDTDQIGAARPLVGRCDIGAIQSIPVQQTLSDCVVTTITGLNFRDSPNGQRIGVVLTNETLAVMARSPNWFNVEYHGVSGWISADYVQMRGDCG